MQATAGQSQLVQIRFKSRNASNQSDKCIAEQYGQGGPFDVELQTTDGKSVAAHRFVLTAFSKTWANALRTAGLDGVIILPFAEPFHITKKVVELLYMREINVLEDEKPIIMNALKMLKVAGIDDSFKPQMPPPSPDFATPNTVAGKIPQQRRASVAVRSDQVMPAKRTLQRSQSVYPDPSIRENNMLPPHQSQPQSHAQRPPNMNGAPNPNRTSVNMAAMNLPSQVSLSMVPRSVNANVGGPSQSAQIRHQPPPPPSAQQQGQMIAQNRQPPQSQTLALSQLQKYSQVTVKKQNPAAAIQKSISPAPSPQKPTNAQATQIQSKLPMGLPAGLSVSMKQTPRNNQQSLNQLPQQQHTQSAVRSAAQTPPAVTIVPTQSNLTENAAVKSVAPAAAVAAAQNGQNGKIEEEIGNLPIAMEIDETIGNGQTNDEEVNDTEEEVDGGNENQSEVNGGMVNGGEDTVVNDDVEHENQAAIDDEDADEFNDFDDENEFEGFDDTAKDDNNNSNTEHNEMRDILSDMQENV